VLRSRKGLSVEIGNTDAEGRLILADALTRAEEEAPELILDFATLTGAARVALGPDLPALFANDDALANDLLAAGTAVGDPLWRMPLWQPYESCSPPTSPTSPTPATRPLPGAVTAALFLQKFVKPRPLGASRHLRLACERQAGATEGRRCARVARRWTMLKGRYAPTTR
jgi:leucyl aminopeptidase